MWKIFTNVSNNQINHYNLNLIYFAKIFITTILHVKKMITTTQIFSLYKKASTISIQPLI